MDRVCGSWRACLCGHAVTAYPARWPVSMGRSSCSRRLACAVRVHSWWSARRLRSCGATAALATTGSVALASAFVVDAAAVVVPVVILDSTTTITTITITTSVVVVAAATTATAADADADTLVRYRCCCWWLPFSGRRRRRTWCVTTGS